MRVNEELESDTQGVISFVISTEYPQHRVELLEPAGTLHLLQCPQCSFLIIIQWYRYYCEQYDTAHFCIRRTDHIGYISHPKFPFLQAKTNEIIEHKVLRIFSETFKTECTQSSFSSGETGWRVHTVIQGHRSQSSQHICMQHRSIDHPMKIV